MIQMTLKTRGSTTHLPGQLVFPFMLAEVERPERGSRRRRTTGLTGRAREARPCKQPARGTTTRGDAGAGAEG